MAALSSQPTMWAARLHGPADLRVDRVPRPGPPRSGQVLLRVKATGICGSDLHSYADARIGDTAVQSPLILGHEFSGVVEDAGSGVLDGAFEPLRAGARLTTRRGAAAARQPAFEIRHRRAGSTGVLIRIEAGLTVVAGPIGSPTVDPYRPRWIGSYRGAFFPAIRFARDRLADLSMSARNAFSTCPAVSALSSLSKTSLNNSHSLALARVSSLSPSFVVS